jgi:endonuclease III
MWYALYATNRRTTDSRTDCVAMIPRDPKSRGGTRPSRIDALLDALESFYGKQALNWPADPYEFLVWWQCGYPASDVTCGKGWESLNREIGIGTGRILAASLPRLTNALRPGGMVPELRARKLRDIASRVEDEFGGDLAAALGGPVARARKILKTFPGIADPGADRILLWSGIAAVAAVPSNCPHVLVRILDGTEREYGATYREAQQAIEADVPASFTARTRAYLLLKHHGQEICKRTNPKCGECPVNASCAYFARRSRVR